VVYKTAISQSAISHQLADSSELIAVKKTG
jgi:hypothetical protein